MAGRSLSDFLGAPNPHPPIPPIDKNLDKNWEEPWEHDSPLSYDMTFSDLMEALMLSRIKRDDPSINDYWEDKYNKYRDWRVNRGY